MSSKQSNFFFGSNRNKAKLNMFWLFSGPFRKTKKLFVLFVSVFQTGIETTEINRIFSKQTEKRFVSVYFNVSDRFRNSQNKQNLWNGELKRLIF